MQERDQNQQARQELDWRLLRDFKAQYHLARRAFEALSERRLALTLKADLMTKEMSAEFRHPPDQELTRLAYQVYPIASRDSRLNLARVGESLRLSGCLQPEQEQAVIGAVAAASTKSIPIVVNDKELAPSELYEAFAHGAYFRESPGARKALESLHGLRRPFLEFSFHSQAVEILKAAGVIYAIIRELEESEGSSESPVLESAGCIYCRSKVGPFESQEHAWPQSLGNNTVVLDRGLVCDPCNNEILAGLDQHLVEFDRIAIARVMYVPFNPKTGKLSSARFQNLSIERTRPNHLVFKTDRRTFKPPTPDEDGTVRFDMPIRGRRKFDPVLLARSIFKVALGILAWEHGQEFALDPRYDAARRFILKGDGFPNALLIKMKCEPANECGAKYYIHEKGTFMELHVFGIPFMFNLEPKTMLDVPAELQAQGWQAFNLGLE